MLNTDLEFAPGTSADCKKFVEKIPATAIYDAYRTARRQHNTSDIVLVLSDQSPDILGGTRAEYARHLGRVFGARAREFKLYDHTAHSVASLPAEENAMWLVIDIKGSSMPIMCVVFGVVYDIASAAS